MKKGVSLLVLVTLLFNIFSYGVAVSAETFPKDPGNVYNDLTGNYGLLGIAGQFHVFAKNKTTVNAHTDGNIATHELDAKNNFGTNLHEGLLNQEINYIQKTDSFINSSGIPTGDTRVNKFVVGSNVNVALQDGHPTVNGSRLDHLTPDDFYKDRDGNEYIDFEQEFARLNVAANDLATATPAKTYTAADFPDMNNRTIDLTGLSDSGFLLVNIDAEVLTMNTPLQIINPSDQVVVFNVINSASALNVQSPIKYNDRSNHETEDFSDANISWNFGNEMTDLTISAPFQGTILAPNATIHITQNQDGTIIGTNVILDAATNRWDPNEIFISDNGTGGTDTTTTSDSTDTTASSDSTDTTASSDSTDTTTTSDSTDTTASSDSTDTTTTTDSTDTTTTTSSDSTDTTTTTDSTDTTASSDSTDTTTTSDSTDTTASSDSTDTTTTSDSTDTTATSDSTDTTTTTDSTDTTASSDSSDTTRTTSDSTDTTTSTDSSDTTASSDSTDTTTTSDSTDTTTTSSDSTDTTASSDSTDTTTTTDNTDTTASSDSSDTTRTTSDSTDTTTSTDSTDTTTTSDSSDTTTTTSSDGTGTTTTSDNTDITGTGVSKDHRTTNISTSTTSISDSTDTKDTTFITSDRRYASVSFPRTSSDNRTNVNVTNKTNDDHLNKSKKVLPKTGSQSNNWITVAGVILLVIGLRITFMSNKKSKR
ncbi:collagen-binding MSCRAMM adhesin Scm [Enterococcus faecium]|uniref:collagen-binding MSCRAMM adhesin Scm n=1 Tax=Enterococcus faecium TaxID=1352 RepID=UPI000A336D96|nr:collagen-binding MSCRAMM adhesin Scm [Enterococcus faecium]OTO54556.1 cell wall surface adhesion protein [Enterococcus faecium]